VLIGISHIDEGGVGGGATADSSASVFHILNVQILEGVGGLEPGAAVVEVQMDGVRGRKGVVDAIEEVLLVPFVVEDGELRRIEKAPGIETVGLDEVAQLFPP